MAAAREAVVKNLEGKVALIEKFPIFSTNDQSNPLIAGCYLTKNGVLISPQIVFLSNDGIKKLGIITQEDFKNKDKINNILQAQTTYTETGEIDIEQPTVLKWFSTNARDNSFKPGVFKSISDTDLYITNSKGRVTAIPLETLGQDSLKLATKLYEATSKSVVDEAINAVTSSFVYPQKDLWKSANGGKTVEAKYISLDDMDYLTLEVEKFGQAPKQVKLPLDKLDTDSQKKAKDWKKTLAEQIEKEAAATQDALDKLNS